MFPYRSSKGGSPPNAIIHVADVRWIEYKMWHLYMVRAKDRSLYTGVATNIDRRMAEHLGTRNKGARYLRGRGPFRLAFHRPIGSRALALKVEHRIKRMSKTKKEELVRSNPDTRRLLEMLAIRLNVGE